MKDNGSVLVSIIEGEQVHMDVTLGWLTNLTGYTITPKIVEGDMTDLDSDGYPNYVKSGGQVRTLTVLDSDVTDNEFKIVIPEDLIALWATQPTPEKPSYGWIGLEVSDFATGSQQQIWKPLRGLVEVLFSPSEEV